MCKIHIIIHLRKALIRCCNNCPRDHSPRRQLSKGFLSNDTVVQGDYCPMGLFSNEAFTNEKLAQINFSYFLLEVTTFIDYRIPKKNNVSSLIFVKSHLGQKSPWTKVCLDNCPLDKSLLGQLVPWTTVPWTIVATPFESHHS